MLGVMRDPAAEKERRDRMAIAARPSCTPGASLSAKASGKHRPKPRRRRRRRADSASDHSRRSWSRTATSDRRDDPSNRFGCPHSLDEMGEYVERQLAYASAKGAMPIGGKLVCAEITRESERPGACRRAVNDRSARTRGAVALLRC